MIRESDGAKAPPLGFRLAAVTAMLCISGISPLAAQTFWQGVSGGNWNIAGNWSTSVVPGNANENVINNIASTVLLNSGSYAINSFNSTSSSANFELFGGALSASVPGTSSFSMTGQLIMQGGATLSGFAVTSGGGVVNNDFATLNSVSFANSTNYTGNLGSVTTVNGTLANSGNFQINSNGGTSTFLALGSDTTFQGAGTVTLNNGSGSSVAYLMGNGATLTNATTIEGTGTIGNGSLALVNNGTINANVNGANLQLNGSGIVTNNSIMSASNGGILSLNGVTVNNAGGSFQTNSPLSIVEFGDGTVIQGGTLNNSGNGAILTTPNSSATLDGSTSAGAVTINGTYLNGGNTYLHGTIIDNGAQGGNIIVSDGTELEAGNNTFTLQGGGTVTLLTHGGSVAVAGIGPTLLNGGTGLMVNVDTNIQGEGFISINGVNEVGGTINANSMGGFQTTGLQFIGNTFVNQGLMEASNAGELDLSGATINNQGGNITANPGASVTLHEAEIQGGTLNNNGGAFFGTVTGSSANLDGSTQGSLTLNGTYTDVLNSDTGITGTIQNNGNILVNGGNGSNSLLVIYGGGAALTGCGTVTLNTLAGGGGALIQQSGASTLENFNNTIQGNGIIGNSGLSLLNDSAGTVLANVPGGALTINGTGTVTNNGTFEAEAGSTLDVVSANFTNFTGNTLTGGNYIVNGTLSSPGTLQINSLGSTGGEIVINAATIILNGPNSNIVDAAGLDALSNLAANTSSSSNLTITGGRNLTTSGDFSNAGTVWIGTGSTMQIGPTGTNTYTQTGGITTVNGVLDPAGLAAVDIEGGMLAGIGSVEGNVLAEGGSISPGEVNATGELTINGNLNDSGSALNIRLGGAGAGGYDVLDVTGNVNLGAGSVLDLSLINGFTPTNGETFTFLDFGSLTSQGPPGFFGTDNGLMTSNGTFSLTENGNDLSLTFTSNSSPPPPNGSPEPGSIAMFASGGLAWFLLRKRLARKCAQIKSASGLFT